MTLLAILSRVLVTIDEVRIGIGFIDAFSVQSLLITCNTALSLIY
jgi:hypothetical protein